MRERRQDDVQTPLWLPLAGVLIVLATGLLAALRTLPPAPAPADAPPDQFSATRAREVLDRVLGDEKPHPIGSPANAGVRQRIVSELQRLGYEPALSKHMSCSRSGACAEVTNILVSVPGRSKQGTVLLACHYDSVGAGPGASDDGAGIASLLEIARILKRDPPRQRPIALLFDDGEEPGLLGAKAFVEHNPLAHQLSAVVNLEARGTSGPALMFETSGKDAALVRALAASLQHPVTSSVFASVYRELPNDTDLTVFRHAGIAGVNFAFIGDEPHYHTPLDNLAHSSTASLQHEGQSALAMARTLAAGAPVAAGGDAVFFDLFAWRIVHFPASWVLPLLILSALSIAVTGFMLFRRGRVRPRAFAGSLGAISFGWLVATAAGAGAGYLLARAGALPVPWIAHPLRALIACWALGTFAATLPSALFARQTTAPALWLATAAWLTLFSTLLALRLPGASYLTEVPLLAMAVTGSVWALSPDSEWRTALALLAPIALAAIVWMPILLLLYSALGLVSMAAFAAAVAVALTPLVPAPAMLPRRSRLGASLGALAVAVVATLIATRAAPFSPDLPQRMSLVLHEDTSARHARWLVGASQGPLPPALLAAGKFSPKRVSPVPWSGGWNRFALAAPTPDPDLPPPGVERVPAPAPSHGRRVRLSIRSLRGAPDLALIVPASTAIQAVQVDGTPARFRQRGNWKRVIVLGAPPGGVEIQLDLPTTKRLTAIVLDRSPGLPASAKPLLRARPASAVPSQDGDLTLVSRRFDL